MKNLHAARPAGVGQAVGQVFIGDRKEGSEQADSDHSQGGVHALMGAEQGDRQGHSPNGGCVHHHAMSVEFSGPVLNHRQGVGPVHRGEDRYARLDDPGFLGGDLPHGAAQHLHVVQADGGDD